MNRKRTVFFFLIPVLLSFILHFRVFDLDLVGYHVWRQTQTQTVIYNFSFSDPSIFNPQRFDLGSGTPTLLYEFPIYQWLIAQVNNVFGYAIASTRVMTFLFMVFMLLGFYLLARKFVSVPVALLLNCCICFSPLLYYYCVNPLPDILALGFGVWTLKFFFDFLQSRKYSHFLFFCLMSCLSALTKLPYLLFASGFLLFVFHEIRMGNIKHAVKFCFSWLLFLVPVALWYLRAIPTWKSNLVGLGISANNKSVYDLFDYFQSNLISSMPELVTNYAACIFLFCGFYLFFKYKKWKKPTHSYLFFIFLFCCLYFFYELNMIEKTHDYYLLPFVPFIFLVVGSGLNYIYDSKFRKLSFVLVAFTPLLAYLRIDHRWNPSDPGFNRYFMIYQDPIKSLIPSDAKCVIDTDESKYIALYYLKRQGYSLYPKEISENRLLELNGLGAEYLVTENKTFNPSDYKQLTFIPLFDKELKVFRIQSK